MGIYIYYRTEGSGMERGVRVGWKDGEARTSEEYKGEVGEEVVLSPHPFPFLSPIHSVQHFWGGTKDAELIHSSQLLGMH